MSEQNSRVLVALSGGMDSAATVILLREAGYEPYALFLDLQDDEQQRQKAIQTAERLQVPLYIEAAADLFRREIIDYLLSQHEAGRTPAPCSRCNPQIKWKLLADKADELGIHYLATGHYVRVRSRQDSTGTEISYFVRGVDPAKDQSYYLWDVPQEYIRRAVLPLGDYTKAEIRTLLCDQYGYREISSRKESMGVCFLQGCSYREYLKSHLSARVLRPGEVRTADGQVVGTHEGYPLYTIGQKRGLPADAAGMAVTQIDPSGNTIQIGDPASLYTHILHLADWRLADLEEAVGRSAEMQITIRGVGRNPAGGCQIELMSDKTLRIILTDDPAWAPAPGQPVVLYLDNRVVGGGYLL